MTYIGAHFSLGLGLVYPTQDRVQSLKCAVWNLLNGQNTAHHYMVLLGKIASCLDLIPNARLFMRPIQIHMLQNWSPSRMSMSHQIVVTPSLVPHLKWWLQEANILKGRSLQSAVFSVTLTTDASLYGWGGHMNGYTVQGRWTNLQRLQHINCLEMEAIILSVTHNLPHLQNQNVMIRTDNTTVVQWINRQGGTKSVALWNLTWKLWSLALKNKICLKASYIAGKKNVLADRLSRYSVKQTEWSLDQTVVSKIFTLWGHPLIDLFATFENKKTPVFCSWIPHQQSFSGDALSIAWQNIFAYAFPPVHLVPRVLQHMKQYRCKLILIAPFWPRQHWFPQLLQMLIAFPVQLQKTNLLSQSKGQIVHPEPKKLKLTAWLLSTDTCLQKGFLKELENYWQHHGVKAQKETITQSLKYSIQWLVY
ncbi:uncharacterized protein LOC123563664 [Mercenaria mercenaria]|uniref:uncharacterized protein LOC123563664 n=1 Tax=Mercenaria mercenaria TaxID=6596 RepID=UPI00234FADB9|nr:uncharacterized protein LOC123563664 [Mercenaria mercenaria]